MPVNVDPAQITPYTSTVPLAQIPPDAIEGQTRPAAPLQGQFGGGKGTPALAIGDSLLKGFMLGHQQKEQRKTAQAQATINAADAASEAAYSEYQTALTSAGGKQDDPKAQAAYQAYITAFQAGKQAKAQFVIPEKTQKGKKTSADAGQSALAGGAAGGSGSKEKKPPSAGFNNIKDFFEANPHIVPQIALLTMQPKPAGLSPEGQQSVQNLESQRQANTEAQRRNQEQAQKDQDINTVAKGESVYGQLTPVEIEKLKSNDPGGTWTTGYKAYTEAQNRLALTAGRGATKTYKMPDGSFQALTPEQADLTPGASLYVSSAQGPPGSKRAFVESAYKQYGVTQDNAPPGLQKYLNDYWNWKQQSQQTTTSITQDVAGNRTGIARKTSPPPPKPEDYGLPVGWAYQDGSQGIQRPPQAGGQASAAPGGIGKPPTAQAAPTGQGQQAITPPPQGAKTTKPAAQGGITPPPGGKQTALTAQVTRQATAAQQKGYQQAEKAYSTTLTKIDNDYRTAVHQAAGDPAALQTAEAAKSRATARAQLDLEDAKASVAQEYDAAVRSIGGTPGSQNSADNPPPGATARVKDANGKLIGYAVNGQFVPLGQ